MAKRPDTPCAGGCGRLLWGGRGSRPAGERTCRECCAAGREPKPRKVRAPARVRICDLADCERKHFAKGMCRHHYRRSRYPFESKNPTVALWSVASLRGAYFPKPKRVTVRVTIGVMVDCPACPNCIMAAPTPTDRFCRNCGTTLKLNPEEVAWLTSERRSTRALQRTAN